MQTAMETEHIETRQTWGEKTKTWWQVKNFQQTFKQPWELEAQGSKNVLGIVLLKN